jgi:hypothetical protein
MHEEGFQEVAADSEFVDDVREYQEMEQKITQDFLNGIIKLGEILHRQRTKWKERNQWTTYVQTIGRTLAGANQFIRIYEYSLQNLHNLLRANVTNWSKLNMFLTLPEHLKEKLAGEIDGQDLSTDDYREQVIAIKHEDEANEMVEVEEEDTIPFLAPNSNLSQLIGDSTLADVRFMSKKFIEELNREGFSFSNNSLPFAEAFLSLEKSFRDLDTKNFEKLDTSEKAFWKSALEKQLKKLEDTLN